MFKFLAVAGRLQQQVLGQLAGEERG